MLSDKTDQILVVKRVIFFGASQRPQKWLKSTVLQPLFLQWKTFGCRYTVWGLGVESLLWSPEARVLNLVLQVLNRFWGGCWVVIKPSVHWVLPGCGSLYSTCHHILCLVNRLTVNLITVIMCFEGVHQVCLVWINIESMSPCYLGCFHQFFVDHRGHTGTIWGPYLHLTLIVWAIICCLTARLRRLLCSRNVIGSCHDWFKVSPVFLLCSFSGDAPPLQGNDYSCTHMCKHCNLTLMLSTTKLIVVHML